MIKILANDGIDAQGKSLIEAAGITVDTQNIPQSELALRIGEYDGLLVRSATKVTKAIIDAGKNLQIVCRGGVGMDNIDIEYAQSKGIKVFNTPASSSTAVAELVFAHLFATVRFLHLSNRQMPSSGVDNFNGLKKSYAQGIELFGKTIGIVGFGRIGREVARIAKGIGMKVMAYDVVFADKEARKTINTKGIRIARSVNSLLKEADFISLHVPSTDKPLIDKKALKLMKSTAGIINISRGGVIDEQSLIEALDQNRIAFACLDVFENEPKPNERLLNHPKISVSPHIGASTMEAQERIGGELANIVIDNLRR